VDKGGIFDVVDYSIRIAELVKTGGDCFVRGERGGGSEVKQIPTTFGQVV